MDMDAALVPLRPATHCKAVSETVGSDGSSLLYMRPLQWFLRAKGFFLEGKSAPHDQNHVVLPSCFGHVERTLVPVPGAVLGALCLCVILMTDAFLTDWGLIMSGFPAQGLWQDQHLSWHINCLEILALFWL